MSKLLGLTAALILTGCQPKQQETIVPYCVSTNKATVAYIDSASPTTPSQNIIIDCRGGKNAK